MSGVFEEKHASSVLTYLKIRLHNFFMSSMDDPIFEKICLSNLIWQMLSTKSIEQHQPRFSTFQSTKIWELEMSKNVVAVQKTRRKEDY